MFLLVIFTYLFASIPFGLVISRVFFKSDIRTLGSKNIGATNVYRTFGIYPGIAVFILDGLKGALPTFLAMHYFSDPNISMLIIAWAVVGHVFPVYLKFKGGKGISTCFLGLVVAFPLVACIVFAVWILVFMLFRTVSISSIASAICLPIVLCILCYFTSIHLPILVASTMSALIILRHRENIKRILNKEEGKFFFKA